MNPHTEQLLSEIRICLEGVDLWKGYLFGSHARGEAVVDSDVDLILVLNRSIPFKTPVEHREATMELRRQLHPLSIRYGLDLIVFTINDWNRFIEKGSWFSKEIQREALQVA